MSSRELATPHPRVVARREVRRWPSGKGELQVGKPGARAIKPVKKCQPHFSIGLERPAAGPSPLLIAERTLARHRVMSVWCHERKSPRSFDGADEPDVPA